ncbi:MAG TPA: methyltransferase [Acidimicrobiales bacterium]|nr:methyltransferase [Acidimicrobiales bacterium]
MPHYFDPAPAAPSRPGRVTLSLPGFSVELSVDRGVFSAGGIDPGTMELLRAGVGPAPGAEGDLLDLGCGYGPIAVTLAHRYPGATVWAVDVNARALDLTAANAAALGFGGRVRAMGPEEVPEGLMFGGIWSNPPIRIGKAALHEMLQAWLPRLADGGSAWLVVQKHLGADSLAAWLQDEGWAARRLGSRKGYRILQVGRP